MKYACLASRFMDTGLFICWRYACYAQSSDLQGALVVRPNLIKYLKYLDRTWTCGPFDCVSEPSQMDHCRRRALYTTLGAQVKQKQVIVVEYNL